MDTTKLVEKADILIGYLQKCVETTGAFVVEQTPLLVQEILIFNRIKYSICLGLGVGLLIVGILMIKKGLGKKGTALCRACMLENGKCPDIPKEGFINCVIPINIIGVLATVFGSFFLLYNITTFIKVWWAPRLFLLEYATDLIQKTS